MKPPSPKLESIDGDKYRLEESYTAKFGYWLKDLQFIIPAGYETDLASIPWFLRQFGDRACLGFTPVVIHDYLCDREGKITNLDGVEIQLTWFQVQLYFLVALELDGVPWRRSLAAFLGVIAGNRWSGKPKIEQHQAIANIAKSLETSAK
jgi:hypothetical protein